MHIAIFCEQHPHTLGGAQMSVLLQAKFLERAGHTVTFVSPALRNGPLVDPKFIDLPSFAVPTVKEYTWLWPSNRHMRLIADGLAQRPPVDVVHVQSDFWGAAFGYRYARQHGIPVVHTMHHRLDVGVDGSMPFPALFYAMLGQWQKWSLGDWFRRRPREAFDYLAQYGAQADVIIAPSRHFARLLASKGVHTKSGSELTVIPTGVDDDVLERIDHDGREHTELRVAWVGRFSPEKRIIEFCRSLGLTTKPMAVTMVGDGALRGQAEATAPTLVEFRGALPYEETMHVIADADVLVQSSNGFETQGMTVTEALSLGTHVVIVDSDIAGDLPDGSYSLTRDLSDAEMARVLDECARADRNQHRNHADAFRAQFRQSSRTAEMLAVYSSLV